MNHLEALTMVSMETQVCQETRLWTSFQKTLLAWIMRRDVTGFLLGGKKKKAG